MILKLVKHASLFCAAWLVLSIMMAGCVCVVHQHDAKRAEPVYVSKEPPPAKQESRPASPSKSHAWVEGRWEWNEADDDYEWEDGKWEEPPSEGATWQEPVYEEREDETRIYTPGYWLPQGAKKSEPAKKPGGATARPSDSGSKKKRPGGTVVRPGTTVEKQKPGGATARPGATDKKKKRPGGAAVRPGTTIEKKKPGGTTKRPGNKNKGGVSVAPLGVGSKKSACKKSSKCNCNKRCDRGETKKTCSDCK